MDIRKYFRHLTLFLLLCLGMGLFAMPQKASAQAGTPSGMLQEINNLRVANGLAPMEVNNFLMLSAQNHADWIAATGQGGHTGEGGSAPTDRAHAVGYPGAIVTENWARGPGLTVNDCIYVSWNDPAHMDNMLDPRRKEFGAGVALDANNFTVYVVNFSIYDTDGDQPAAPTVTPGGPTVTTAPLIQPLTKATPRPDGSIVHVVQYGQTLWAIADLYEVPLADILALNSLTLESTLYPDEELIIRAGTGETPQATQPTSTPAPEKPTRTPSPTPTKTAESTPTPTEEPPVRGNFFVNIFSGDTLWVGIGLVAVSVLGIALLLFTSSRLR